MAPSRKTSSSAPASRAGAKQATKPVSKSVAMKPALEPDAEEAPANGGNGAGEAHATTGADDAAEATAALIGEHETTILLPGRAPARVVVEDVTPIIDGGRYPAKRVIGEPVTVEAAIYAEGHDHLWCVVAHQPPGADEWLTVPMSSTNPGLDRWRGTFTPQSEGIHRFKVLAWIDEFGSWASATTRKLDAGVTIESERLEGAAILDRAAERSDGAAAEALREAAEQLRLGDTTPMTDRGGDGRLSPAQLLHASLDRHEASSSTTYDVLVERERALFSSWYELFPRSWGPEAGVHGTFADVERQLDYVAGMGFDILYLPPIHPIGTAFRKGPNNSERAGPDDVGSPWAIGGPEGGHTAIHPDLGTLDDFRSLVEACKANGMELALDIALQCSPDHPWVTEHPEWFKHRPDGTIQYAENPPKKYQDIYPLNFESDDWQGLWQACLAIFTHWMDEGIRVFRVDNPHTKPFAFWGWLIEQVHRRDPGVIFLSEAFSRPKIMHRLAQVGFTQSYSYFPWRVGKHELIEYFTELTSPPSVDQFRPSAWPNTPDILPWHLMDAPRRTFGIRAFVAATMAPSWGIYGPSFELGDNRPAGNGKEEYLDSEKYELRWWSRNDPGSIRPLIAELNRIRTENLALHTLRTLTFHEVGNDDLLCFSKTAHSGPCVDPTTPAACTILVIVNLDPHNAQAANTWLDLAALGVDADRPFDVTDLLTGRRFTWHGSSNYVELHPELQAGHVFRVTQG